MQLRHDSICSKNIESHTSLGTQMKLLRSKIASLSDAKLPFGPVRHNVIPEQTLGKPQGKDYVEVTMGVVFHIMAVTIYQSV